MFFRWQIPSFTENKSGLNKTPEASTWSTESAAAGYCLRVLVRGCTASYIPVRPPCDPVLLSICPHESWDKTHW